MYLHVYHTKTTSHVGTYTIHPWKSVMGLGGFFPDSQDAGSWLKYTGFRWDSRIAWWSLLLGRGFLNTYKMVFMCQLYTLDNLGGLYSYIHNSMGDL